MTFGKKAQYEGEILNVFGAPPTATTLVDQPMRMSRSNYLVNNINHISDQRSQVVANWSFGATNRGLSTNFRAAPSTGGDPNGAIVRLVYQARLDPDGIPYPIRVMVQGYTTGTSIIRVRAYRSFSEIHLTDSFTSASATWQNFSGVNYKLIKFSTALEPDGFVTSYDTISSTILNTVPSARQEIVIEDAAATGRGLNIAPILVLSGLYIAEYVGDP